MIYQNHLNFILIEIYVYYTVCYYIFLIFMLNILDVKTRCSRCKEIC